MTSRQRVTAVRSTVTSYLDTLDAVQTAIHEYGGFTDALPPDRRTLIALHITDRHIDKNGPVR